MKKALIVSLLALIAAPAMAADLQTARSQGKVCEKPDGFVMGMDSDAGIKALVAEVNSRRKQEYARISQQNGQPADVVARLAMPQILAQGAPACK